MHSGPHEYKSFALLMHFGFVYMFNVHATDL